ncbi:hypothetical protein RHGRI_026731 [Rhododendron griersonianum]|uniref:Homeobox domain-containing protein n=1 Tax=Rhododendron griersonianum TaxID=479676 RepID=A0AAV6IZE8_9ERIC|nr:hypothetical protein RHGRI_026731 [Rhododendron griersonianum]
MRNLDINQVPSEEDCWTGVSVEIVDDYYDGNNGGGGPPRKKLRLTKEQSRLLEESFRHNPTLNPEQAKADGNGVRVLEEMVRVPDRAKPTAANGGGRTEGHEGGAGRGDLRPQLRPSAAGIRPVHVPPLRAGHCHH